MTDSRADQHAAALARLDRFSYWTDSQFGIPFTRFRIGIGPLIAMVPVIGDVADLLLSLFVLNEARRIGAGKAVIGRMLINLAIDFFGGLLPVVGDVFDMAFKANTRNTELLRSHLQARLGTTPGYRFPWRTLLLALALGAAGIAGLLLLL
ncbi:DUF4112 domain-containing protein [Wenzhouxiangella marina]|uniref:Uncharacterized protein n=1 Tax=Wenzhouxiangella marina TaxID=1579979 RepID=A0A0K0XS67_9GAMM|nr:DUF4112 domain-containing protein [Wenzhouxiangella marina]AKS40500.1 hypothetical protein WM2015_109 [Wenzhouxiangella marina]MBB6088178.1 hypothetical protein [Wenzhouxiangella marina]